MHATASDLSLIATLVAVGETSSFSRAAVRLGVTKGTVSRKIAQLEEQLGVQLVQRTTRHVSLSGAGREICERASGPLRSLAALTSDLPAEDTRLAGEIRFTAPPDLGVIVLPDILERFMILHPAVTFDVRLTNAPINLVRSGMDLALRIAIGRLSSSSLRVRPLGEGHLGYYASPSYLARRGMPRSLDDPEHEWLMFVPVPPVEARPSRRDLAVFGRAKNFIPKVRSDDLFLLRDMVQRGIGVAGLPDFVAEPLLRAGAIVRVLVGDHPSRRATIFMLAPAKRKIPRRVESFRDHLVESFAARSRATVSARTRPMSV